MPDWRALAARFLGVQQDPIAYSRITRTPIYSGDDTLPEGYGGVYKNGGMTLRQHAMMNQIPHESAHAIYDQAGLKSMASSLVGKVGPSVSNYIRSEPIYRNMDSSYAGSPEQVSDEGLSYSIGDKNETGYVNAVAAQIKDPKLQQQLLRLHRNAVATRKLGGLGEL